MAIDPRTVFENYIPSFSIQNVMLDKMSGAPLSGGSVGFYEDLQRLNFKPVYQITGTAPNYTFTQLPNPVPVSLAGDFIDAFGNPVIPYYYAYDNDFNPQLYYVKCLNAGGQLQFEREAQPYFQAVVIPTDTYANTENLLSNPQFVQTYFNNDAACTLNIISAINQVLSIAPDWDLIVSGTGSVTFQRIALTSTTTPTNPPFVLDITSGSISALTLRQRLYNSPRIMSGGFISAHFIAASVDASTHQLTWSYVPSNGTLSNNVMIQQTITNDGIYNTLTGQLQIIGILNPDPATNGYVDINLSIPIGAHIRLSSFQIVGTLIAQDVPYDQQVTAQQINRLFHDYQNSMIYMPKHSLTPWWKFALNPYQLIAQGTYNITPQCSYIFDQTILWQPLTSQVYFSVSQSTNTNGAFTVGAQSGATDARFALITYIAPQSAQGWWGYWMSTLARAQLRTLHGSSIHIKARLIWRTTLPSTIGAAEPIASWIAGTDPTFSAGWTAIAPLNDPAWILGSVNATDAGNEVYPAYLFNQMQMPLPNPATTNMVGLVIYIMDALNSTSGTEDYVAFDSISLVPNQFAVDSVPLTFDEVKRATQFYIESSYPYGNAPGTTIDTNSILISQRTTVVPAGTSSGIVYASSFGLPYQEKCIPPNISIYNPISGSSNSVEAYLYMAGGVQDSAAVTFTSEWTENLKGTSNVSFQATNGDLIATATISGSHEGSGNIILHALLDSQLGQ